MAYPSTHRAAPAQIGHTSAGAVSRFVRHFVEMRAAMCVGEPALDALMLWAAASFFGYANPFGRFRRSSLSSPRW